MTEVYLVGGVRTPVGRFGGALAGVRADDLAALVVREAVNRSSVPVERIDDVVLGAANQSGEDNRNVGRMAALLAGLPVQTPGYTVNRLCASGLQAIASAAQAIKAGDTRLSVAGGAESMTRAPWVMAKPARAWSKPGEMADTSLGWRLVNPLMRSLDGAEATMSLGECTEKLATLEGITRDDADEYAARSHDLVAQGWERGDYADEIVAVPTENGLFEQDETVRPGTTLESLARLKPAFGAGGVCTAGNSSPLSDGASAIVVAGEDAVREHGLVPRARIVSYASAGVAPSLFGTGPVPAIAKALQQAGLSLGDMDAVDINEAFAAQVVACQRMLGLDRERLNPAGGAIALGHPLGSSGCRIVVTLLGHLERTGGRYGVASLCIGVGQGSAMVIERL
ncbi:MAG: thiolase family protein [Candidatus Nanopelagicales bacterium]